VFSVVLGASLIQNLPTMAKTNSRRVGNLLRISLALMSLCLGARAQPNPGVPWPATDELGRSLPLADEVGPPKTNRFVGIFYFIDHLDWPRSPKLNGPFDVAKILALDPSAGTNPVSPLWGSNGVAHYWGEPLYGYYRGDDPWVLRRHAQMLADAGVDVLIFDTTNARSYPEIYTNLCEVFESVRRAGGRTPQIAFMVNTEAGRTAKEIFHELYQPGRYAGLWFQWEGRPLMICDPADADAELRSFFTLRAAHWPFTLVNTRNAWHWEATYPQPYGYTDNPRQPEQVNVSVAQNLSAADGAVANMNSGQARGRSFHDGGQNISPGSVDRGANFQEQWRRALQLDPPFVMVTGWNEWVAGRWVRPENPLVFVDQYDEEFSRDIEPMRGGHGDNYYWQLIANVRRYKGAPAVPRASEPRTISVSSGFYQWQDVEPEYADHVDETLPRDFAGTGGLHYANHTGRNEFAAMKVARDRKNIYFYARTGSPIVAGTNWMWLLIDSGSKGSPNWEGYNFIVNRKRSKDGDYWLEKSTGGWNWQPVVRLKMQMSGNELQLAIPRTALGLKNGETKTALDFKWADNLQHPGDVMDFYLSGDVAPDGRFNYRYVAD
jgi:hypothetical protein